MVVQCHHLQFGGKRCRLPAECQEVRLAAAVMSEYASQLVLEPSMFANVAIQDLSGLSAVPRFVLNRDQLTSKCQSGVRKAGFRVSTGLP